MIKEQQNFASFKPILETHSQLNQEQLQQFQQQALFSYIKQLEQRDRLLSQENQKLKEENAKMQEKLTKYESKQGEMTNEIQDMQTLLKRVYLEGEIQAGIMRKKNIELSNENQVLKKSLNDFQQNMESYCQFKQIQDYYDGINSQQFDAEFHQIE